MFCVGPLNTRLNRISFSIIRASSPSDNYLVPFVLPVCEVFSGSSLRVIVHLSTSHVTETRETRGWRQTYFWRGRRRRDFGSRSSSSSRSRSSSGRVTTRTVKSDQLSHRFAVAIGRHNSLPVNCCSLLACSAQPSWRDRNEPTLRLLSIAAFIGTALSARSLFWRCGELIATNY